MSTYEAMYQQYLDQQYLTLIGLVLLALEMIGGWYLFRRLFGRSKYSRLAESIYLTYCGLVCVMLVVAFI